MKRVGLLCSLLLLLTALPAEAHYGLARSRRCADVLFQPNTDYGAIGIRARHMSCHDARDVARRFGKYGASRPYGFHCRTRGRGSGDGSTGQAHTDVRCVRGRKATVFALT